MLSSWLWPRACPPHRANGIDSAIHIGAYLPFLIRLDRIITTTGSAGMTITSPKPFLTARRALDLSPSRPLLPQVQEDILPSGRQTQARADII